jgi:hypothetical protein
MHGCLVNMGRLKYLQVPPTGSAIGCYPPDLDKARPAKVTRMGRTVSESTKAGNGWPFWAASRL